MPNAGKTSRSPCWRALAIALLPMLGVEQARGAGAFVVEDAEVDRPGTCKVQPWGSFADNRDMIGVTSPACAMLSEAGAIRCLST
jgi:hypothetical protein